MESALMESLPERFFELYDVESGLESALMGKPHKVIAESMGLSQRQYFHIRAKHALFKNAIDRARADGHDVIADSVLTLVEDNPHLCPQDKKILFDTISKYLGWMDPQRFGDRMTIREEHVDLKGALTEAKARIINLPSATPINPFEE